jgi:hypothetical protein
MEELEKLEKLIEGSLCRVMETKVIHAVLLSCLVFILVDSSVLYIYAEDFVQYLTHMFQLLQCVSGRKNSKGGRCSQVQGHFTTFNNEKKENINAKFVKITVHEAPYDYHDQYSL